jgi:hypothetical protein
MNNNRLGQWTLLNKSNDDRCWTGYEPTPGKKAYEKGSCRPVKKDDAPHEPGSPEDSAHDVVEEDKLLYEEIRSLDPEDRKDMLEHLRTLKDRSKLRSKVNAEFGKEELEVAPENSTNKKTYLKAFGKSDGDNFVDIYFYNDGTIDVVPDQNMSDADFSNVCDVVLTNGYEEVFKSKDWSPKAKHKSDSGGLTEEGRKSYNRATGGKLKAPQPGGGPRKRSFCARNKGQLKMHNIDCSKTPEKRACKARRRWKC